MDIQPKQIHISDYDYPLPDERIAKYPLEQRDQCKLLIYDKGLISEDVFYNITNHLPADSLMIFNDTKVIQARLHFTKETGALIEIFLLEPAEPTDYEKVFQTRGACSWHCLIGNAKKWKVGQLHLSFEYQNKTIILNAEKADGDCISFTWNDQSVSFAEIIDAVGELPIPPYLNRKTEDGDKTNYQTIYSRLKGSVAAPTAGLHFTDNVMRNIASAGVTQGFLTLHVGAGTFKPVKSETIGDHEMHAEHFCVNKATIEQLIQFNGKVIAVGTTSVRTLESLYYIGLSLENQSDIHEEQYFHIPQWMPYDNSASISSIKALQNILNYLETNNLTQLHASTQIIIAPSYSYKIVNHLVTNFHQPKSTLLLLVSAFLKGDWKSSYRYALEHDFRFLSYGDCCLMTPKND